MEQIERIQAMEARLDRALAAVRALERALDGYEDAREDLRLLSDYLAGQDRWDDLRADEEGLLPDTLRRGVLSEDGIYDLLEENDELLARLRELCGTEMAARKED